MAFHGQGQNSDHPYELLQEDESGSEGADGTLSLYSRLIYSITKKQLIAKKELPGKAELAGLNPVEKASYVGTKLCYKDDAKKIVRESASIAHTIRVFKGKSKFKSGPDASADVEGLTMGSSATFMDFIITFFRSAWQVFSNVIANLRVDQVDPKKTGKVIGNDDSDNPDSHYNQTMYQHNGDPSSGLSPIGMAGVAFALAAPVLGLLRGFYQIFRKNTLKSFAYARQQNMEVNSEGRDQTDSAYADELNALLKKAMKENILSVYPTLPKQPLAPDKKTFLDKMIDAVDGLYAIGNKDKFTEHLARVKLARAKRDAVRAANEAVEIGLAEAELADAVAKAKRIRGTRFTRFAATAWRTFVTTVSTFWTQFYTYSYIFWLAYMPFVMICGLAAVSGPMMPFVLLITLTLGTALTALNLARNQAPKPTVPDDVKAEFDRLAQEVKMLKFFNEEHSGITTKLQIAGAIAQAKPRIYPNASAQSNLRERLLGSIHERRARVAIIGLRSFIGGLLTIVFAAWFGSALIGYFGATAIAGVIGGAPFGGIGGAIAGLINSAISMAQMRQAQLAYEQKVDTILQAPYKNTDETKAEAFQRLYAQVEHRKSLLRDSRVGSDKDIAKYLDEIDPFNPELSKFRHKPTAFTWFKKGLNRVFEFVFGGQTGAFTARFFLLSGGLLAGALGFSVFSAGVAFVPFLIVAAVLIVVMGALAVTDYQMKKNQGHREGILNTLDSRIYYLEKKNEELCALQIKRGVDAENAGTLVPVVQQQPVAQPQPQPASSPLLRPLAGSDFNVDGSPDTLYMSGGDPKMQTTVTRSPDSVTRSPDAFFASGSAASRSPDTFFASEGKPRTQPTASRSLDAFFASGEKHAQARVMPELPIARKRLS